MSEYGLTAPPSSGPKILLYDIETAPSRVFTWGQWQQNVVGTDTDWYMLSFAYKWLEKGSPKFVGLVDDPKFVSDTTDDTYVTDRLWQLFDQADIVIAHNGDKFDQKKANARFLANGMGPPSPYQSVDTLKEAKRYFSHYSNALNELARFHEFGGKTPHSGFKLWRDCMAGDRAAWRLMKKYNRQDVVLLETLYLKLRPWIGSPGKRAHPNLGMFNRGVRVCPKCGAEETLQARGTRHRGMVNEYKSLYCNPAKGGCKGYSRARLADWHQEDGKMVAV